MEFQKLIEERRTIRKYSPESRITKEDLLTSNQGGTGSTQLEELPDRKILLCDI